MRFNDLVQMCGIHSDKVRAALNALPPDIVMDIPEDRLPEVIHRIGEYGRARYEDGEEAAIRRANMLTAGTAEQGRFAKPDLSKWPPAPGEENFCPTESEPDLQAARKNYWVNRGFGTTVTAWAAYKEGR